MQDPNIDGEMDVAVIESQYKEIDDQLKELEKLVNKYQSTAVAAKERGDAETLSNTLVRLARVNCALGTKAKYALYVSLNAKRAHLRVYQITKLNLIAQKNPIGKAEAMADIDQNVESVFKIYLDAKLLADTFDDLSYRTDTFLKMAQSGLSLIKNDIQGKP